MNTNDNQSPEAQPKSKPRLMPTKTRKEIAEQRARDEEHDSRQYVKLEEEE